MATRSGSSFQKRQKEKARQEKQREKLERKISRKDEDKTAGGPEIDYSYDPFADSEDYPLPPELERAGIV